MTFLRALLVAASAILLLASPAAAHVFVTPETVPAGSFSRFSIGVLNERKNPTVQLKVQLPPRLVEVRFEPKPGWKRTVTTKKLANPIEVEGETVTERVDTVTWSGGEIGDGEFDEFVIAAGVPDTPGKLSFPAIQTYANGEVVRWIGAPDSDEPAALVTLEAAEETAATRTSASESKSDDDDHDELALAFGIAGLAAGLLALGVTLVRRRRA